MRPIPRHTSSTRVLIALIALAVLALTLLVISLIVEQRPAHATGQPGNGYASAGVVPGGTCTTPGVVAHRGVEQYRCVQKPGEDCPHWHWIYNPDTPKSTRTAWPAAPCATCSPSPTPPVTTPPAATTPAATPPPSSPPTPAAVPVDVPPAAAGELPVTGAPAGVAALVGALFTMAGVGLRFLPRRC